jgi:uncharacterized membrane protein YfhO
VAYRIQSVAGYDPLYLERYGELIAAMERGEPNIEPPFGFNRIITPQNYTSRLADLLNVKYVLSLSDIDSPKLALVFREGETRVYQNKEVMPRVFWVGDYRLARNKKEAIVYLFEPELKLGQTVILEDFEEEKELKNKVDGVGRAVIDRYEANRVEVSVEANKDGWLVLTDSYYPVWRAKVDGRKTSIYRANFNFRAIMVPAGRHQVVFEYGF